METLKDPVETLDGYLTNLASDAPAPGGGSAAMVVGAAGCALVAMVARICAASPKYEPVRPLAARLVEQADALRERMLEQKQRDEAAFDAVVGARGNKEAMQRALFAAACVPLEGAQQALAALHLTVESLDLRNGNLVSDVGCAAEFAYAALASCAYNVRINHKFMKDESAIASQREALERCEREGAALLERIRTALRDQI